MPAEPGASCGKCRFYGRTVSPLSTCQRRPPVVLPIGEQAETQFPYVRDDSWCGEFEPAELVKVDDVVAAIGRNIVAGRLDAVIALNDRLIEIGLKRE